MKTWNSPVIEELNFTDTAGECIFGRNPDGEYIEIDFCIFRKRIHLDIPLYS